MSQARSFGQTSDVEPRCIATLTGPLPSPSVRWKVSAKAGTSWRPRQKYFPRSAGVRNCSSVVLRRKYRKVSLANRRTEDPRRTASCFQAHTSQPLTSLPSLVPPIPAVFLLNPVVLLSHFSPFTRLPPSSPTLPTLAYPPLPDASAIPFLLLFPFGHTLAFALPLCPLRSHSQTSHIQLPTDAPIDSEAPLRTLEVPFFTS